MGLDEQAGLSETPDEQLVQLYRDGTDQAYVVLVERYRQELFHFLIRFTNDPASAEDLFQEAFLQVHLSVDSFDTDRRFRPWLFTIAANKARDYLRRNKQKSVVSLSTPVAGTGGGQDRQFVDLIEADLPLPGEQAQHDETQQRVREAVASLPDHLREILVLAYFHQFPYKQIAEMLGIPLGTVKSRLHSAVGTFAQRWKELNRSE